MIQTRATLKSWFEEGDYPTQEQFGDLIDSFYHKNEDSVQSEKKTGTFTQGDLNSELMLTLEHKLNSSTPLVTVFDNTGLRWTEVNITVIAVDANTVTITFPAEIEGTWKYRIDK